MNESQNMMVYYVLAILQVVFVGLIHCRFNTQYLIAYRKIGTACFLLSNIKRGKLRTIDFV